MSECKTVTLRTRPKNTTCRLCDNRKYYYNIQKQMHVVVKVAVRKKLCDVVDIINQRKLL